MPGAIRARRANFKFALGTVFHSGGFHALISSKRDAAAAVRTFGASHRLEGISTWEDELVGLCMHAHRVRLISCALSWRSAPAQSNR